MDNKPDSVLYLNIVLDKNRLAFLSIYAKSLKVKMDVKKNSKPALTNDALKQMTHKHAAAKQQLIDGNEQLGKGNKELETLFYAVHHDLRAPLRAISFFSSMLEDNCRDELNDEAKRFIDAIQKNSTRMGNLIDGLLNFSLTGCKDLVKAHISTNSLIKDVIANLNLANPNLTWNLQALPDTYGDINTIRQVWVNLISNAVKYSGNEALPSIEIGSFQNEGQTVFFIKDNGAGFEPKYKDKLFKVFQSLHTTREFEGTGLGLAIIEKIISRHGGKVWADAEKNKGATFYFSLPPEPAKHPLK